MQAHAALMHIAAHCSHLATEARREQMPSVSSAASQKIIGPCRGQGGVPRCTGRAPGPTCT
eukprot:14984767-Alexandrium_andersonii.AAC.1